MPANPGLQLSLDVKGRSCLVLGGDEEAAEKVHRLLEAGARVTVIHPTLNDTLRKLTASAKILHRGRRFRAADTEGIVLVVNTLQDDFEFSASLLESARKERFLLWSRDQPETSNVAMPAIVSRGHLRVAISTSGVAPALAGRLRQDLEQILHDEMVPFLEWLGTLRDETQAAQPDAERRRALFRQAVEGFRLTGAVELPSSWNKENGDAKASQAS